MSRYVKNIKELHQFCDQTFAEIVQIKQIFSIIYGELNFVNDLTVKEMKKHQLNLQRLKTPEIVRKIKTPPQFKLATSIKNNVVENIKDKVRDIWVLIKRVCDIHDICLTGSFGVTNIIEVYTCLEKAEGKFLNLLKLVNNEVNKVL